jgi:glutaminase
MKLPLQDYLEGLHAQFSALRDGAVASYIPELAKADPDGFGICIATLDGHCYAAGDADRPFTLQSLSKPLVYGAALADRGRAAVLAKVGVEPSGDAFNSISLAPGTGAPLNPMINAGAIAVTAMVAGDDAAQQWQRIEQVISGFAGRPLRTDEAVYRSESETGFRNRAIAWMLRNFGITEGDPMTALENYFRQCSLEVTCRDLAFIAATLANRGVHPRTGQRALPAEHVPSVLSVMATCGMYDYAGSWLFDVGMPAKSGVGGGILAVLPGRFGIGVYSPALDEKGNSVRGLAVCRQISRDFRLHVFGGSHRPELVIGRVYRGKEAPSRRLRSAAEAAFLGERASLICCLGLQGEVALDGAELVARRIAAMVGDVRYVIVDLHRVSHLEPSGARLLHETRMRLAASGLGLVFARAPATVRDALDHPGPNADRRYLSFDDDDLAMEWCENQLLAAMTERERADAASPSRFSLFAGLHGKDLASVCALLEAIDFRAGDCVLEAGEEDDDRIFLVLTGQLSVLLPTGAGRHQRLSTLGAGACFGEMLLLGHRTRSASVFADSDVSCWVLSARRFEALAAGAPDIKVRVLENIARDMSTRLRNLNALISALAS